MVFDAPRVLIASDIQDLLPGIVKGYSAHGYDVITGINNFKYEACRVDLLHVRWPEELTEWKVPSDKKLIEIERRLDRWLKSARLIVTVNNLYPHSYYRNPQFHKLYTIFYERSDVIHHYSKASFCLTRDEYPSALSRNHVISLGFNYDYLLPATQPDRVKLRSEFGVGENEILFLLLGSLRSRGEVELIKTAFRNARIAGKSLLWCARYFPPSTLSGRLERYRLGVWRYAHKVKHIGTYIPECEMYKPIIASDVVVSVRLNILNSGIPSLGMTFGRYVVAADLGSNPEFLSGAENALYDPTSSTSLAKALEKAAMANREEVGARNCEIAASWTWEKAIGRCLDPLGVSNPAARAKTTLSLRPLNLTGRTNTGSA